MLTSCPPSPHEAMSSTSVPRGGLLPQITAQPQLQLPTQAGSACTTIWQSSHGVVVGPIPSLLALQRVACLPWIWPHAEQKAATLY